MMVSRQRRVIGLFLTLSAICLTIGIELTGQRKVPRADVSIPIAALSLADAAVSPQPANGRDIWFDEIVSRPLFSPDRKLNPVGGVPNLPRLTAIIAEGSRRIAIFAAQSGSPAIVAGIGSRVGIYDVQNMTDDEIILAGPQGTMMIHPTFDAAPPAAQEAALPAYPAFFKVMAQ